MPARLLRLLSLLQTRPRWTSADLCARLEITERTLRRDIDRLRGLDYPIHSLPGRGGGYRLRAGKNVPPLLLDDDEAVALSVSLGAVGGQVPALADGAERLRVKLDQLLPETLRLRVNALQGSTAIGAEYEPVPEVDPESLIIVGECCREGRVLAFDYADRTGTRTRRRTEPHQLITVYGLWYLVAHDQDRDDWRTFRVDRISLLRPAHDRFRPRQLDAAAHLRRRFGEAEYAYTAILGIAAPAIEVRNRITGPIPGAIVEVDADRAQARFSADRVDLVVQYAAAILALDLPVTIVTATPPVAERLAAFGPGMPTGHDQK